LILILDIAGSQILRFLPNVSNMFWGKGMTGTKAPLKSGCSGQPSPRASSRVCQPLIRSAVMFEEREDDE